MAMRTDPADAGAYDYVIVGAGSAGCVLANRLTESGATVLLLEAGGWDRDPLIHVPLAIGKIFPDRMHDWGYFMQPDHALDERGIECARGKVVGGSSSVNAMTYVRGHRSDFDRWAATGLTGWDYAAFLPYFRRSETWDGQEDAFRGKAGPLRVQQSRYTDPLLQSFTAAGRRVGYQTNPDYNGEVQEGFGPIQETIHKSRRWSAATAYLRPALRRRNLRVITQAQVDQVLLEDRRATGVAFRHRGISQRALARREVILCGGTINTPKLLMLSGIGDPDVLRAHGISVAAASPGVGQNLQDHLSVLVKHRRADEGTFQREMRYDRLCASMARAWLGLESFAGNVPFGVTAFVSTAPDLPAPDVQFLFIAAPFPAHPYFRPFRPPVADGYGCRAVLLRPESRGTITLASADPDAAPVIRPNFLSTARDRQTLADGVRLLRRVFSQPDMAMHDAGEVAPGPAVTTDEELAAFIRYTAITVHHPAGTCRMGVPGDHGRVVDGELRVVGVEALRVADASVMPDMVGGNINAVVIAIAEKAADLIAG